MGKTNERHDSCRKHRPISITKTTRIAVVKQIFFDLF